MKVNSEYSESVSFSLEQVKLFAELTGDKNPIHTDAAYVANTQFKKCIVPGLFAASVFPKMMVNNFPGPGTVYIDQSLNFKSPVYHDILYTALIKVIGKRETSAGRLIFKLNTCLVDKEHSILIDGIATILI